MAIPLGQPVEEITRGVEGMKIGGHVRAPENASKQQGSTLPSTDVATVQAHHIGQEHAGCEVVPHTQSPEESAVELGNLMHLSGKRFYVENSAVEQQSNRAVEPAVFTPEQIAQDPYVSMTPVPLQGSLQTGYPSPYMDPHNYYPYYMGGDIYNSPVTSVYNQNYYYTVPGVDPYGIAYAGHYCYPQYQVAAMDQYSVSPDSLPLNGDGVMASTEVPLSGTVMLMPYGYQQPVSPYMEQGQWVPVAMYAPTLLGESPPNFDYLPQYVSDASNLQPPACFHQRDGQNGSNEGDELKHYAQLPSLKSNNGLLNESIENSEGIDDKIPLVENKKVLKKQLSLLYGSPMPIKGSWVRSENLQYLGAGHPLKVFNAKIKSAGMRVTPNSESLYKPEVNSDDFSLDFEEAKHFVIKSFSEENVIRSIQYGVWASTANGNKKLDEVFRYAKGRGVGKANRCPVLLYFSVNGSGRFCGVAEMVGPVDYNNTMDFWERNRWCGSFPVKWHFIKDVPHSQLRRIILHNNENKPVTSSRDTQEVNFEQGLQMLSIIKSYSTKSSILDSSLYLQRIVPIEAMVEGTRPDEMGEEEKSVADENTHPKAAQEPEQSQTSVLVSSPAERAASGEARGGDDAQLQEKQSGDAPNQELIEEREERNSGKENMIGGSVAVGA